MSRLSILAFGLSCAVVSMGCGGSGGGPSSPSPPPSGGTPPPSSNVITISITGIRGAQSFSPNPAQCATGQTVVFKNDDVITHRVVIEARGIDTGDIAPGASSAPLQLGGVSAPYHCSLHPNMVGSLNEAETPEPPPCGEYCD